MVSAKFVAILISLSVVLCYRVKNKREMLMDFDYLVSQLYVQHCTFVEVGEGVCSLFVELPVETKSCPKKQVKRQMYFGNCLCSEFRSWQLCSRQLKLQRPDDCVFEEGVTCPSSSARVHRRLCDITGMSQWNPQCNCSVTLAGMPQDPLCGFRTCYSNPLPASICQPRSVCGTARCDISLHGMLYSIKCDRKCKEHQSFCERSGPATSTPRIVKSEWSEWQPISCEDKSNIQQFEAECLDSEKNPAFDCLGPGMLCCNKEEVDCICEVKLQDGHLKVFRYTIIFGGTSEKDHSAVKVRSAGFRGQAKVWNRFLDMASKEDSSDSLFSNHKELKNSRHNIVSGLMNINNSVSKISGGVNNEALYYNILNLVNGSARIQEADKRLTQPNELINKVRFQNSEIPNVSKHKTTPNKKKETITNFVKAQINEHSIPKLNIVPVTNRSVSSPSSKETSVRNVSFEINNANNNVHISSDSVQQSEYNDLLKKNQSNYHSPTNLNKLVTTTTTLSPKNSSKTPIIREETQYTHGNITLVANVTQNSSTSSNSNTTHDNNIKHNTNITQSITDLNNVGTNVNKVEEHHKTTTDLKAGPKTNIKYIKSNTTTQGTQDKYQKNIQNNHENSKEKSNKEGLRHSSIINENPDFDQSVAKDQSNSETNISDKDIQSSLSEQNNYKRKLSKKGKGKIQSQRLTSDLQDENNLDPNLDSMLQTKHMVPPDTMNERKSTNGTNLNLLFSSTESPTGESKQMALNNECTTSCLDFFTFNKSQINDEHVGSNITNLFKTQTVGPDYNSTSNDNHKYRQKPSEKENSSESLKEAHHEDTIQINNDSCKKQNTNNKINGESTGTNLVRVKPVTAMQTYNSSLIQTKGQEIQNHTTNLPVFFSDIDNLFPNVTRPEAVSKKNIQDSTKDSINLQIKTVTTIDPLVNLGIKLLKSPNILHDQKDPINLMSSLNPMLPAENDIQQPQNDLYDEPEPVLKDLNKESVDDNMVSVLNNMVELKHQQQKPTWIENKEEKVKLRQHISNVGSYKEKLEAPTEMITVNKGVQMDSLINREHDIRNTK